MVYLHAVSDALTVRQELGQVLRTEDVPEGGLSQQAGGGVSIGHIGHRGDGVTDAEVHHTIHTDCNWIFGKDLEWEGRLWAHIHNDVMLLKGAFASYLLWWDVKRNCSQIHFYERISAWQNKEDSWG